MGVTWSGDGASYRDFEQRHGLTVPSLVDADGTLFARFKVPAQPAWVLVASDGTTTRVLGAPDEGRLKGLLDELTT